MKILLFVSDLAVGGAQTVLGRLASGWIEQGFEVTVLTTHALPDESPIPEGARRIRLDVLTLAEHLAAYRRASRVYDEANRPDQLDDAFCDTPAFAHAVRELRRKIRSEAPAVVISFGGTANLMLGVARPELGRDILCIAREGNDPYRHPFRHMFTGLRRFIFGRVETAVCNTRSAAHYVRGLALGCNVHFIANPVPPCVLTGARTSAPTILCVARLIPQKDHATLLHAFADARLEGWRLAVVGGGELEKALYGLAENLGISNRVDWHGHQGEPARFYPSSQIIVLASRFEGMPNALIEGMRAGLAPVATRCSAGIAELISDGENGLTVPVGDAAALADSLASLVQDARLRKRLGRAARASTVFFDPSRVLAQWDQVLGSTHRRRGRNWTDGQASGPEGEVRAGEGRRPGAFRS